MDIDTEQRRYEGEFERMPPDFADVEWVVNQRVSKKEDLAPIQDKLRGADGLLLIHLSMGTTQLKYFTGEIIEVPDTERGCHTKITVRVDGDLEKLWQNWANGLHRVTRYGDLLPDVKRFCRFKGLELVNEA